jgi:hypothetical protein
MKKALLLTGILNMLVGLVGLLLFVCFGGFDLYLGSGTPMWLCWIPSVFFLGGAFNILTAIFAFRQIKRR